MNADLEKIFSRNHDAQVLMVVLAFSDPYYPRKSAAKPPVVVA